MMKIYVLYNIYGFVSMITFFDGSKFLSLFLLIDNYYSYPFFSFISTNATNKEDIPLYNI